MKNLLRSPWQHRRSWDIYLDSCHLTVTSKIRQATNHSPVLSLLTNERKDSRHISYFLGMARNPITDHIFLLREMCLQSSLVFINKYQMRCREINTVIIKYIGKVYVLKSCSFFWKFSDWSLLSASRVMNGLSG